jgi:hypothetical protein
MLGASRSLCTGFFLTQKRSCELRLGITVETTENREGGVKLCKLRYARSALGPCHNGRVRAAAVTNGRQGSRGTPGHRLCSSCSWDDAGGRFGLWSRRSGRRRRGSRRAATGVRNDGGRRPETVKDRDRRFRLPWAADLAFLTRLHSPQQRDFHAERLGADLARRKSGVQIPSPPPHRNRRSGRMESPGSGALIASPGSRVPSVFRQGLPGVLAVSFVSG